MSFSLSEYTKIDVDWGFVPTDPTAGELTALPQDFLAGFKGAVWRGRKGLGGGRKRGREGKGEC